MAYRLTPFLNYPIGNTKKISSDFWEKDYYDKIYWGIHLGVDIDAAAETKVFAVGRGTVVYSGIHLPVIAADGKTIRRNWGGILIIAHKNPRNKKVFFSIYGHLGRRYFKRGDLVEMGEVVGTIGHSQTESNGGWEREHLHFAIYSGPFHYRVLPGYYNPQNKVATRLDYWESPLVFIKNYNRGAGL